MNERETRQDIVDMNAKVWQLCWNIECNECPYHKHGENCMAYVMELNMKLEGYYNNKPDAAPIHETIIKAWENSPCKGNECSVCRLDRYYGGDCFEHYWARELYRAGWRKKNDKKERLSTTEQQD